MKKTLILGVLLASASCAFADFLYWQVPAGQGEFTSAELYAIKKDPQKAPYNDTKLSDDLAYGDTVSWVQSQYANGVTADGQVGDAATGPFKADISQYSSGYSFFVELVTYDASGNATNTQRLLAYSYDTLLNNGYIDAGSGLKPVAGGGTNFSMTHVPEPSSGLLMLLGGALMALRRRRRA